MLSLHTNNASLSAQSSVAKTQQTLSTAMTRLSTGFRINSSMDDAAGLQIATRLKAQTSGMAMAMQNTQKSTSMLQTADGALNEVSNMLVRMKDLATQAADVSSTTSDKTAMQAEFDALTTEITNVMGNTTFGGTKLLTGGTLGTAAVNFQIGATTGEQMSVDFSTEMGAITTATAASNTGTSISSTANATIDLLDASIAAVSTVRSHIGATNNRLDHINTNLMNISNNTKAASGRIMDTDFATESSTMTSSQMLLQAGTAMLKQSNSMSSMVMSLLQ
ncbi:flagellin [Janthinobacterium sp. CG_23.3]|uniref:flagellin N-terminal helical domain-containing protein n=1 Tax=unclassified Janthinobacterium TaxID=2610881 RepID=UPI00034D019C|nr:MULTISPECIES: flagellin [unclassified Janthinobacterium]MEC5160646.1 flagellin [Janthinobacterium sp. CG_S6]